MQITDVRVVVVGNPWKNWIFVRLLTDEGVTGLGEATAHASTLSAVAAIEQLKSRVLGLDPCDPAAVWSAISSGGMLRRSSAMAGIETACWDILGKSLGVPVWRLLGGRVRARVRAYANGWYRCPRTPEDFASAAKHVVAKGYTALKFDPFGSARGHLERHEERLSLAIVAAVREAVGDDVDIMIEAHDRFAVSTAVRVGNALAEYDPLWLEAPVWSTNIEATLEVARQIPVPVACGERFDSLEQFARLGTGGSVGIVQPEYLLLGGLRETVKAAAFAEANEALVAPHSAQSPLCTAVNAQLAATVPNFLIQETFDDFLEPWAHEVITGAPRVVDGHLEIPDKPGLGIELDETEAERHPYDETNMLRLFEPGWEKRAGGSSR